MPKIARVTVEGDVLLLRHDPDPQLADGIRIRIPPRARSYDGRARCWRIEKKYTSVIDELLAFYGFARRDGSAGDYRRPPPKRPPRPVPDTCDWAKVLHAALPEELRERAYKALLPVVHPDTGGSTELAQQLNTVFRKST